MGSLSRAGLHFHFSLSCTGEGNGNPLQCSCLENLRDRRAWWAAIYGVTQSWTRLKRLSSSSSSSSSTRGVSFFMLHCSSYFSHLSKWQWSLRGQIGEGERANGNLSVKFGFISARGRAWPKDRLGVLWQCEPWGSGHHFLYLFF